MTQQLANMVEQFIFNNYNKALFQELTVSDSRNHRARSVSLRVTKSAQNSHSVEINFFSVLYNKKTLRKIGPQLEFAINRKIIRKIIRSLFYFILQFYFAGKRLSVAVYIHKFN